MEIQKNLTIMTKGHKRVRNEFSKNYIFPNIKDLIICYKIV